MTSRFSRLESLLVACATVFVLAALPTRSRANSLLNLQVQEPKVAVYGVYVDYDAGYSATVGKLTASGMPGDLLMTHGGAVQYFDDGQFTLDALIDKTTGQALSASMQLDGDFGLGGGMQTLFASTQVHQFGSGPEDLFEFVFRQSTSLKPWPWIGVVLDGRQISDMSDPDFTKSFHNDGAGKADVFAVPTPTACLGAGALLIACAAVRCFTQFKRGAGDDLASSMI